MAIVIYSDVNPIVGLDGLPIQVTNDDAINASLFNLFSTLPGQRFFDPEYGCDIPRLVWEPMDDLTAGDIFFEATTAITKFEPRVKAVLSQSSIVPDYDNDAYNLQLYYQYDFSVGLFSGLISK